MMLTKYVYSLSIATLLAVANLHAPTVYAHDVDIYVNNTATSLGTTAKVMISLDLRSSVLNANGCPGTTCNGILPYLKAADGSAIAAGSATKLDVYRAALAKVLKEAVVDKGYDLQIGFLLPHDHTNNCAGPGQSGCSNGGYMLSGFVPAKDPASPAGCVSSGTCFVNTSFLYKVRSIPSTGNHPFQASEMFFELYRYLKGGAIYNGKNGWRDYGTNNSYNLDNSLDYSPADATVPRSWDAGIMSGTNYVSPIPANVSSCTKFYTINFMFGTLNQDADSSSAMATDFGVTLPNQNNSRFETVLRYLYDSDLDGNAANGKQNVTSYFVVPAANNTENAFAQAGTGGAVGRATELGASPDELVNALKQLFDSILATSTMFVAPSVSVNVYNRSQVLQDFFIAMFQVDDNNYPRWPGNVKKFALRNNASGTLEIQDINNSNAVDSTDGRVKRGALSYWTVRDDLPAPTGSDAYDVGKDGRQVDRGGAGSRTPGTKLKCDDTSYLTDTSCYPGDFSVGLSNPSAGTTTSATSARRIYTEPDTVTNGSANALANLNADSTTANNAAIRSALGSTSVGTFSSGLCTTDGTDADATSACNLLKFARGMQQNGSNRDWMMGDILHSRPLALNYGTAGGYSTNNPNVRVLVGTNDGTLRMIRNTTTGGAQEGVETWAFMPRKAMGVVKQLKNNTAGAIHPYGVDSTPVAYIYDADLDGNIETGDKVIAYFGLGRGGDAYYALDITDPENPSLLWRIQRTVGGDFDELGETWSTPRVGRMVYGASNTPQPVVIFAGGYDPNKDTYATVDHPAAPGGNDSKGNAVYIVNGLTGALIWKAALDTSVGSPTWDAASKTYKRYDIQDSIPSTVAALDMNANGLIDRLYVGDTGGRLWRADLASNDQANWTFVPIMSVGRHASNAIADDRRFFYPPDVVQIEDVDISGNAVRYDAIAIGTGDREAPLYTSVQDYFYMFKDFDTASGTNASYAVNGTTTHAQLGDVTDNCLQTNTCTTPPNLSKGWRLRLVCPGSASGTCGEKNLAEALSVAGTVYFTTYMPPGASSTCGPQEGNGLLYAVNIKNATAVFDFDTATAGLERTTTVNAPGIPTQLVPIGNGKLVDSGLTIRDTQTRSGMRTYWYQNEY